MAYRYFIVLLLLLAFSTFMTSADEHRLTIGAAVTLRLPPDEDTSRYIDLERGQSFIVEADGDARFKLTILSSSGEHVFETFGPEVVERVVIADFIDGFPHNFTPAPEDTYEFVLSHNEDAPLDLDLSLTEVPVEALDLGERVLHEAGDPILTEYTFTLDAPTPILIETNGFQYTMERVHDDGTVSWMVTGMVPVAPVYGRELQAGQYRIVPIYYWQAEWEQAGFVAISRAGRLTGHTTPGTIYEGDANGDEVQVMFPLEEDDSFYGLVISDGAQVGIRDADGDLVTAFGHAMVAHELAWLDFTAPNTGTYTMNIMNPIGGSVYDGPFTVALSHTPIEMIGSDDFPAVVELDAGEAHLSYRRIADRPYQLTVAGLDGDAVNVEMLQVASDVDEVASALLLDETLTDTTQLTIEAQQVAYVLLRLSNPGDDDIAITVTWED